ncbi:MAG: aminotransferase-like domain-containing protein [Candidatus Nanopelagicales bacterium]
MSNDSASLVLAEALGDEVSRRVPGERFWSTREIQRRYAVSPLTVQQALESLHVRGVVEVRPGRGTFVAAPSSQPTLRATDLSWQTTALGAALPGHLILEQMEERAPAGVTNLKTAYLDTTLQPLGLLAAATSRASRREQSWMMTGSGGLPELRAYFAQEHGGTVHPDSVLIVSGGQAAATFVLGALGQRGRPVLVESPTYPGILAAAANAGVDPVPVPTDMDGVLPDALDATFTRTAATAFYCQPRLSNPTGSSLAPERRAQVLEIVERHGAFLIEDDYLRDLDPAPTPAPTLFSQSGSGHVIYLRTLTKTISPGLRIGAVVSHGPITRRIYQYATASQLDTSALLQAIAIDVLASAGWKRHLRAVKEELRARREALWGAVDAALPGVAQPFARSAALAAWIALPDGVDEDDVVGAMIARGFAINPGRLYFPAEPWGSYARLCISSAAAPVLRAAVTELGRAVHAGTGGPGHP